MVPKPSSNRLNIEKMIFQQNECHPRREHDFEVRVGPRWHSRRLKIATRRVQVRLGSVFLTLEFLFRDCIVLGSVLVPIRLPKWVPRGVRELCESAVWVSKTVLKSSWFGSLVILSFGIALWSSWAPLGVVFERFGGRFGVVSTFPLIIQTINS